MPDPRRYGEALLIAGAASVMIALLWRFALAHRGGLATWLRESPAGSALLGWLQLAVAAAAGLFWLGAPPRFPPLTGLDRLFVVTLPGLLVVLPWTSVAWSSSLRSNAARWMFAIRALVALATLAALLHGSVYLRPAEGESIAWSVKWGMLGAAAGIAVVWELAERLGDRGNARLVVATLGVAQLATGIMILLAGYLRGGAAAFPLAGGLFGAALAWAPIGKGTRPAAVSCGVMGLCGLAVVGRCFGGLTTFEAAIVVGSPLAAWFGEWAVARRPDEAHRRRWLRIAVQAGCVLLVLAPALRGSHERFERKMRPLIEAERGGKAEIP